ncbi:BMP family ABC transporter substrate-binding protein [Neobacillus sp. MM2021_6]|uniref:BMP family lipoprotein n=1 Tax=Bacillaceae TaxID=186817 RepID=UPI00140AF1EC|nr:MULTISPECIES: BMP family ABC transporter substrate-binding protein [Bacillaceae]MBO0959867.1 BMP family ABC transporter substrate-binding protein [Neobacillus sp. MM2021_6]NHC20485.1 BMP family ABC transporter substrate-binding protein [Bacillus sp. MM2020_4]
MKKRKIGAALALVLAAGTLLGACGKSNDSNGGDNEKGFSVAMVTDVGGVDDKSFNQSSWEGLQKFGKENGLKEGKGGYEYLASKSDADYTTNLNALVRQKFDLVYAIGFLMPAAVEEIAKQQKDNKFAIVDAEVKQPNVASILFKEQEAGFLAGVAAALTTKSNQIGFIGGMEVPVIERFNVGFLAGVKAAKPEVKVDVQYAGAFDKAEVGQAIASKMYSSGTDVIFHAAGATGVGLFKEANDRKKKDPSKDFWAIGVDRDQADMGADIVLTSALKRVDVAVNDLAMKTKDGHFPGGKVALYGLAEDGVGLAPINDKVANKAEIESSVKEWIEKIKSGDLQVPETQDELKTFSVK